MSITNLQLELINKVAAEQDNPPDETTPGYLQALSDFDARIAADPALAAQVNHLGVVTVAAPFGGVLGGALTGLGARAGINYLGKGLTSAEKAMVGGSDFIKHLPTIGMIGGGLTGLAYVLDKKDELMNHPAYQETMGRFD